MVKRVSLFQAVDGATFETEALAKDHEATIAAKATLAALLKKLKADGATVFIGDESGVMLESFLLDNRQAFIDALVGIKPEKKTRQPRKVKQPALPEKPVIEEKQAPVVEAAAAAAPVNATGNSDAQLDSLVAELGAQA